MELKIKVCEEYLKRTGVLKTFDSCIHCHKGNINVVRDGKYYKCSSCNKEFSVKKDSILEGLKIDYLKFLTLLDYFEKGYTIRFTSKETKISKGTVKKVFGLCRKLIFQSLSGDSEIPPVETIYFESMDIPVFGIAITDKKLRIDYLKHISISDFFKLKLKKRWFGRLVCTCPYQNYESLIAFGIPNRVKYMGCAEAKPVNVKLIKALRLDILSIIFKTPYSSTLLFSILKEMEFRVNAEDVYESLITLLKNYKK